MRMGLVTGKASVTAFVERNTVVDGPVHRKKALTKVLD